VSSREPYGGGTFIADTSAWSAAHREPVRDEWSDALRNGQITTCPITRLELLFSTRNGTDFDEWQSNLARLRDVPITRSVTNVAEAAFRELAHRHALYHRSVRIPDLLVAACAEDAGIGVLHYDEDFDRLAEVMSFDSRWIAPRGSLS
jgi:predicted nucleic acid-binding protein